MLSLIIPVYNNLESLPELMEHLKEIQRKSDSKLNVVFVVDASPDNSFAWLSEHLPSQPFSSQLVLLSRNSGAFTAIRAGLEVSESPYYAVMAADLQEPPQLIIDLYNALCAANNDIAIGQRTSREDPLFGKLFSRLFWAIYRRLIQKEMPAGGVDVFACNQRVRNHLLQCAEVNSSLVGLLLWMGFSRVSIPYERQARKHGRSGWRLGKKLRYMLDSILAFSDLPILLLLVTGIAGLVVAIILSAIVLTAKFSGLIAVPGYTATIMIVSFFAGLNAFGLGIIGSYVWRTFENTKKRPPFFIARHIRYNEQVVLK